MYVYINIYINIYITFIYVFRYMYIYVYRCMDQIFLSLAIRSKHKPHDTLTIRLIRQVGSKHDRYDQHMHVLKQRLLSPFIVSGAVVVPEGAETCICVLYTYICTYKYCLCIYVYTCKCNCACSDSLFIVFRPVSVQD